MAREFHPRRSRNRRELFALPCFINMELSNHETATFSQAPLSPDAAAGFTPQPVTFKPTPQPDPALELEPVEAELQEAQQREEAA